MAKIKLGNIVYYFTYYTGINYLVKKVFKLFKKDCGCDRRRKQWNDINIEL